MKSQFSAPARAILAILFAVFPLRAQYNTASLGGTVIDPSGSSIPGAQVTVQNTQTGLSRRTTTATDGNFLIPSLPVGSYRLQVEKAGFTTYVQENIVLAVNQAASQTVQLQLGSATEKVTVSANAELMNTRQAVLSQVVNERQVTDLPLNGRQAQSLVFLAAGTVDATENYCGLACEGGVYPGEQQAAVNGTGPGGINYQLDGAGHNDTYLNANLPFPNPDAVQEFDLQSTNFSAEYGQAVGGVVNIVTKSGTNQIHGSAFEFLRNGALNARNFFAPEQDSLKRNQFGGSIGGPIRKDKLFFFGSYQGTRIRTAPEGQIAFVPNEAERGGDFSALLSGPNPVQLMDPVTGAPFPNNQVPVSPVAASLLQHIPLPNGANDELVYTGPPVDQNDDQMLVRLDYNRGRHQINGRYFLTNFLQPAFIAKTNLLQTSTSANHVRINDVGFNDTFTISPTTVLSSWFGWHIQHGGSITTAPFGFPDVGVKVAAVPNGPVLVVGVSGFFDINSNWNGNFDREGWTVRENLTRIIGNHEILFGGEIDHIGVNIANAYLQSGFFFFQNQLTGSNLADFILGRVSEFDQGGGEYLDLSGTRYGLYLQDNWRVHPRLSLNLGLRWDPYFPYSEGLGRILCFVPGAKSARFPNAPTGLIFGGDKPDPGCPPNGSDSNLLNLAPRVGFAYKVTTDGKTTLRGGAGIYYIAPATDGFSNVPDNPPFSPQVRLNDVTFDDPYGSAGMENPFPAQFAPHVPPADAPFVLPTRIFFTFQRDFHIPRILTWNLTLERQVRQDFLLRVAYTGNRGTWLYGGDFTGYDELNPAIYYPGTSTIANTQDRRIYQDFSSIHLFASHNNSRYNSLQLSAEKRMGRGVSFLANYTWAKTLDDFGPSGPTDPFNRRFDYGRSRDDIGSAFKFSGIWQLPNMAHGSLSGGVLNGWQLNAIWTWRGGFPYSVVSGLDNSFSGIGSDRADFVKTGNPQLSSGRNHGQMIAEYFDTSFFTTNTLGTFGNSGKNILRGPKYFNVDMGILKTIPIAERLSMEFRAEFFNTFNNVNFYQPDSTVTDPAFGQILSARDPRILQFALKLRF
jgi:Carboxypeptidase regulatory-like domain/TonB dependent receptor-like, beta-barrel